MIGMRVLLVLSPCHNAFQVAIADYLDNLLKKICFTTVLEPEMFNIKVLSSGKDHLATSFHGRREQKETDRQTDSVRGKGKGRGRERGRGRGQGRGRDSLVYNKHTFMIVELIHSGRQSSWHNQLLVAQSLHTVITTIKFQQQF